MYKKVLFFFFLVSFAGFTQEIGILKYGGGGDWYSNATAVPNLIEFTNENTKSNLDKINIEDLSSGMYLMKLYSGNSSTVRKILKE